MNNILKLILFTGLIQQVGFAQTEATFQDSARPYGMSVVGPVMEAGSDADSATFQTGDLPVLLDFVNSNLRETQALSDIAAVSLDPEALLLSHDTYARVYFLTEGAGYKNTLGYSTTNVLTGESSAPSLIFPDASSLNGYVEDPSNLSANTRSDYVPLIPGDFVDLGPYAAGTLFDFFLIADGARSEGSIFTANASTNADLMQHVVAFAIPDSPYLMIGFEDTYNGGDLDYNDLVFAVDIGTKNVEAYLANPEPSFWMMMSVLCLASFVMHRRRSGEILANLC